MNVSLDCWQQETIAELLSDERDRCVNMLRSLDGRPLDDEEVRFWHAELTCVEELIEMFNKDDDDSIEPPLIDGVRGGIGQVVFWYDKRPWWIVEWQPDNGRVFAIVNSDGGIGLASADELTRDFRVAQGRGKESLGDDT